MGRVHPWGIHGGVQFHAQWTYLMWGGLGGPFVAWCIIEWHNGVCIPILDANHSQNFLTSNKNIEDGRSNFLWVISWEFKGSCWFSSLFDTKGSSFVSPLCELRPTLDIKSLNKIFFSYYVVGLEPGQFQKSLWLV